MYDTLDTLYIQELDSKNHEPQKVFNSHKEYVTDISADIYLSLNKEFIVQSADNYWTTPLELAKPFSLLAFWA